MSTTNDVPLLYTTKGNLPIALFAEEGDEDKHLKPGRHFVTWEVVDDYIKFVEVYTLNGEVVKSSPHVYIKKGLQLFAEQGSLN